jgi:hypothetical protein
MELAHLAVLTEHITDDLLRVDQLWLGRNGSD